MTSAGCPMLDYEQCPHSVERVPGRVFVAYPYRKKAMRKWLNRVRERLRRRQAPTHVTFFYADHELKTQHQLCKICRQIRESELCLFDLRDANPNVAIEFGLSVGKGVGGILIMHKRDREVLPSDLAGLGRLEFRTYADLADRLCEELPRLIGTPRVPAPSVGQGRRRVHRPAAKAPVPRFSTQFGGTAIDSNAWNVEPGQPRMIHQENGLWVEWAGDRGYSKSGNLTLKAALTPEFEVRASLLGFAFGIGWDPGVYLYAGSGADMVLGVNLMPPVRAWGILNPLVVARTPRTASEVGRLNFNHFGTLDAVPGTPVEVRIRVRGRLVEAKLGSQPPVEIPLPTGASQLVVGGFRWTRSSPQTMRQSGKYCVTDFSYRTLTDR